LNDDQIRILINFNEGNTRTDKLYLQKSEIEESLNKLKSRLFDEIDPKGGISVSGIDVEIHSLEKKRKAVKEEIYGFSDISNPEYHSIEQSKFIYYLHDLVAKGLINENIHSDGKGVWGMTTKSYEITKFGMEFLTFINLA
jgi:hypothetical protein